MKQGEAKSRCAKDAIWPPWMAEHAIELSGTILARPLDCHIRVADGLYLASPIPYPLFYTRLKVNGTVVLNSMKLVYSYIGIM